MEEKQIETIYPLSSSDWRKWLKDNHHAKQSIWVVQYKRKSTKPTISWTEAVDEALCYGWIDSTRKSIDEESFRQLFTRRKPSSVWSKINKHKVVQLINEGRMEQAGLKSIEIAKQNGSWTILDEVEELIIPDDLKKAFDTHPSAESYFGNLSKSNKKIVLKSIAVAKRAETREKRIKEFVAASESR
jgi:uncharacterized protein YdeI (YjbR/CyaY-like superfamily)